MGDEPERIKLWRVRHRCHARWRLTTLPRHQSRSVQVQIGELLDSLLWYVDLIHHSGDECRAYPDEQSARTVAQAWMDRIGGTWEQIPCYPTQGWQEGEQDQSSTGSQE